MRVIFKKIIYWILEAEARAVLKKFNPKIVAVTGNVGKTSTKEVIYAIFKKFYSVRKSEKSYNSEIGVPLTILGLKSGWNNPSIWFKNILGGLKVLFFTCNYPKWLILEIGADRPGDIKKIARWLKTDVVVLTRIAEIPAHIEFFKSQKEVVGEKAHLVKTLKEDGTLVLNYDDSAFNHLREKAHTKKIIGFGFNEGAEVRASNYQILCGSEGVLPEGSAFKVEFGGSVMPAHLSGLLGRQMVYSAIAALSAGVSQKFNFIEMLEALKEFNGVAGRFRILKGIKKSVIIDDTYNSSPIALESALETMKEIGCQGRKIAVLGDMLELGKHTEEAHKDMGKIVPEVCDLLVTVGMRARGFSDGAKEKGFSADKIFEFGNSAEAGEFMKNFIKEDDMVLVKGSQGMRMEKIVFELLEDKQSASKLLVRQDEEWKRR